MHLTYRHKHPMGLGLSFSYGTVSGGLETCSHIPPYQAIARAHSVMHSVIRADAYIAEWLHGYMAAPLKTSCGVGLHGIHYLVVPAWP